MRITTSYRHGMSVKVGGSGAIRFAIDDYIQDNGIGIPSELIDNSSIPS